MIVSELQRLSRPATDHATIARVAAIAGNNDATIGTTLASVMEAIGHDVVITVEDAPSLETTWESVDGLQFDRGYLSASFVTDQERMETVLEHPLIVICEKKITTVASVLPVLEQVGRLHAPLLVDCGRR